MKVTARVENKLNSHSAVVATEDITKSVPIPHKTTGYGSGVNGGELLFLSIATCYCNDIYREAEKRNIKVNSVEVEVEGNFGLESDPAYGITYRARVDADADPQTIDELIDHTDKVAEIHNTLRKATTVRLIRDEPQS